MATANPTADNVSVNSTKKETTRQRPWLRFELMTVFVSFWYLGGLFIDGWAHNHGRTDESFFTIWHAVFYSGYAAVAFIYAFTVWSNVNKGKSWSQALPKGHHLSLIGIVIFGLGGGFDMIWHTLLGVEEDIEALLSPAHLILVTGMVLVLSGAFLSFTFRKKSGSQWLDWLPAVLSLTFTVSVIMFITQYLSPTDIPLGFYFSEENTAENNQLYMMNADGTQQTRLSNSSDVNMYHPAASPSGQQIAFVQDGNGDEADFSQIYIMNLDGSDVQQVTSAEGFHREPAWSPDGDNIAFAGTRDGVANIYVMNIATGEETQITDSDAVDSAPEWSPNGEQLLFANNADGDSEIFVMDADGNNITQLTDNQTFDYFAEWSPDGEQILYASVHEGQTQIFVMNADGSNPRQVTESEFGASYPAWLSDNTIVYTEFFDNDAEIFSLNLESNEANNLSNNAALNEGFATTTADGSIIYRGRITSTLDTGDSNDLLLVYSLSSMIISTVILVAAMMLLIREGRPPFGAMTILWTLTYLLLATQDDGYQVVPLALATGLASDILIRVLDVRIKEAGRFMFFAFIVPVIFFAMYFGLVQAFIGISWTVDVWSGSIFLVGAVGLFMAYIIQSTANKATN